MIRGGILKGGDTVIVSDPEEARLLYTSSFYGKFIGLDKVKPGEVVSASSPLHLSILDAVYLAEKGGSLEVVRSDGSPVHIDELREALASRFHDPSTVYGIYRFFRDGGGI